MRCSLAITLCGNFDASVSCSSFLARVTAFGAFSGQLFNVRIVAQKTAGVANATMTCAHRVVCELHSALADDVQLRVGKACVSP